MRIDFRPSVVECRLYERGGYKDKSKYLGSFVMHLIGDTAEVTLLTGVCEDDACSWDTELDREVGEYAKDCGMARVCYEHNGKRVERIL